MNKYLTELIGTFFLALTFGITAVLGVAGDLAPLAMGAIVVVMVYAGAHQSGAHYNPAVTIAACIRGRCEAKEIAPYLLAQLIGAAAAAGIVKGLFDGVAIGEATLAITRFNPDKAGSSAVVAGELFFTFLLVYVILIVLTSRQAAGNSYFGLAIGFTYMAGCFAFLGISLASFNPALTFSLCLEGRLGWADSWMHFFPQVIGATLAAFTFKALNPDEQ